jgi:hypothetical protein
VSCHPPRTPRPTDSKKKKKKKIFKKFFIIQPIFKKKKHDHELRLNHVFSLLKYLIMIAIDKFMGILQEKLNTFSAVLESV